MSTENAAATGSTENTWYWWKVGRRQGFNEGWLRGWCRAVEFCSNHPVREIVVCSCVYVCVPLTPQFVVLVFLHLTPRRAALHCRLAPAIHAPVPPCTTVSAFLSVRCSVVRKVPNPLPLPPAVVVDQMADDETASMEPVPRSVKWFVLVLHSVSMVAFVCSQWSNYCILII